MPNTLQITNDTEALMKACDRIQAAVSSHLASSYSLHFSFRESEMAPTVLHGIHPEPTGLSDTGTYCEAPVCEVTPHVSPNDSMGRDKMRHVCV